MRYLAILLMAVAAAFADPTNASYGRLTPSGAIECAPVRLDLGNIVHGRAFPDPVIALNPSAEDYASQGWLPVVTNAPVREGWEPYRIAAWYVTNDLICARWEWRQVVVPPRNLQLSKMKLKAAFKELGVWDAVWNYIKSDEDMLEDWRDSVVLDERDDMVQSAFRALVASGVLSSADVEDVIVNSVTEIEVRQ
jgi:hypothetical protein